MLKVYIVDHEDDEKIGGCSEDEEMCYLSGNCM